MDIEQRIDAIKAAIVAETGMGHLEAVEVRLGALDKGIACTADGGDAVIIDRAAAEASDDERLRFIVNHEMLHAHFMKHGTGRREFTTVVPDDSPYAQALKG